MPDQTQTLTTTEFAFDDHIFTVDCTDPNEPLFSLNEVCDFLGYSDTTRAARRHVDPEDASYAVVQTSHGAQRMRMVNEAGLYALVFASKLPKAKGFKRKVFREILPSIRKTGEFQTKARKLAVTKDQYAMYVGALKSFATGPKRSVTSAKLAIAAVEDFEASTGLPQTNVKELMQAALMIETSYENERKRA